MASRKPEYLGEPTLGQVMRRPQWILAFLLAMLVAAVFAWLGQWQMGNAIRDNTEELTNTETARPIDELTEPIAGIPEASAGAVVTLEGTLVRGDYVIVEDRMNAGADGDTAHRTQGVWVVGHLVRAGEHPASLAVTVGWAPDAEAGKRAIEKLDAMPEEEVAFEGRYLPAEAADVPKPTDDPHVQRTMLPAYLANVWERTPEGPIYGGYLVMHEAGGAPALASIGLEAVDSVAPSAPERVSWLNVFYAIEWIVFAGVAMFLWYRLARDAWEKEHEMKLLIEAEAEGAAAAAGPRPDPAAPAADAATGTAPSPAASTAAPESRTENPS